MAPLQILAQRSFGGVTSQDSYSLRLSVDAQISTPSVAAEAPIARLESLDEVGLQVRPHLMRPHIAYTCTINKFPWLSEII